MDKLQNIKIRGNLHSWFSSYLIGRKQRVTAPGGTSSSLAVTSGVPQGSILGPVLFLLYVNDIHDTVTASSVSYFADDTKLFKTINSQTDANLLQNDLNNLSTWSKSFYGLYVLDMFNVLVLFCNRSAQGAICIGHR